MKTVNIAAAALVMASTAAHAGGRGNSVSFEIEGQKVRIEVARHCDQLSCIKISAPGLSRSGFNLKGLGFNSSDDDDVAEATPLSSKSAPAPAAQATTAQAGTPQTEAATPAASAASDPPATVESATPAPAAEEVAPASAAPISPQAPPVAAAPIGVWRTEGDKGNVRVEQCGPNLCGYALGSGEEILINMKHEGSKWVGRIHDPNSGQNYDSMIAMKGQDMLRVQGCAFGGLFCGGQTWKRVS
jgi:uncharacterized protein (DUF2147 family)